MYKPSKPVDPSEYSRKIKNRGDARREQDRLAYEAHKKAVLAQPRPLEEDIDLWGIGRLKVQLMYQPAFEPGYVWDIREKVEKSPTEYVLYENELASRNVIAPGYKRVEVSSQELSKLLESIYSTRFSLSITPTQEHGLDGVVYGINIYENYLRVVKLAWWENSQEDLRELDEVVKYYIELFKVVKNKQDVA